METKMDLDTFVENNVLCKRIWIKPVKGFNGEYTVYSMWVVVDFEKREVYYTFLLGDFELCNPFNTPHDWKCETYAEALEWWEDIDEDYFFDEEDLFDHDLEDTFDLLMGEE